MTTCATPTMVDNCVHHLFCCQKVYPLPPGIVDEGRQNATVQSMMFPTTGLTNVDTVGLLDISVTQIFGFVIFGNSTILHPYLSIDSVVSPMSSQKEPKGGRGVVASLMRRAGGRRAAGRGERGEDRGNEGEDGGRNDDHVSDLSMPRRCDGGQRSKGRVGVDEVLALES